jgi:hypothetical protein
LADFAYILYIDSDNKKFRIGDRKMRRFFTLENNSGRVVSVVLSLIILVSLTSCGKNKVTGEDTTPPSIEILSPLNNSEVSDTVGIAVDARDNKKVAKVEFYIDSELSYTATKSPWSYNWITYLYEDSSSHTIFAVAYDQANNRDTSSVITVLVRVSAGFYFISDFYTPGMAYDVFVQGDHAFVADGEEGLRIINVKNPTYPYSEGTFNTSGFAQGVFVSGNYAYLADGQNGLQIVDISDPSNPDSTGRFGTPGFAEDVFVSGNYAYVADGGGGLQIIDVTDPSHPDSAAQFIAGFSVKGVFISGDYAYLATVSGLQIVDVSDPTDPTSVGFAHTTYQGNRIFVEGHYTYLAALTDGLHIFDVYYPHSPVELDTIYNPGGKAHGVFVKDNLAYIAFEDEGVHVIDVSDPDRIEFVDRFDTEGKSFDLFVSNKIIYVADNYSLVILRLSRS